MQTKQIPALALGLMLVPAAAKAQRNSVNDGRYYSDLVAHRPRFRYRGGMLEVIRWFPRRGFLVTERYRPFSAPIFSLRLAHGAGRTTLRRSGFHPVTLFLKDGHHFRRVWARGHSRGNPTLRPVIVWQRNGEYFRPATDCPGRDSH
jgi:hypothetical protein